MEPALVICEPPDQRLAGLDGDCACAQAWSPAPLNSQAARPARWQAAPGLVRLPLGGGHAVVFNRDADGAPAVLNEAALRALEAGPAASGLSQPGQQLLWSLGVLAEPGAAPAPMAAPTTLVAWLHVTERCNLACDYCYLRPGARSMSAEAGATAVAAVFQAARAHHYEAVKLKYAGGEATLNFARVVTLHEQATRLARADGITLQGVLLTNGTHLTQAMLDELRRLELKVVVSLDGVGPAHDRQRPFANGAGSFARVAANIERLQAAGLPPDLNITITDRNVAALAEVVSWALDRRLRFSLNFYRETDRSAGQAGLALREQELLAGLRAAFAVIEQRPPRFSLVAALLDRAHLASRHAQGCEAGRSYLAFDAQGRAAACPMLLGEAVSCPEGADPLAVVQAPQNLALADRQGCAECDWRAWCAGGCPLQAYRASGRWDGRSPLCGVYRALLPEVLRLEGLRLLRQYRHLAVAL